MTEHTVKLLEELYRQGHTTHNDPGLLALSTIARWNEKSLRSVTNLPDAATTNELIVAIYIAQGYTKKW